MLKNGLEFRYEIAKFSSKIIFNHFYSERDSNIVNE